jgi:hypothetical protein
MTATPEPINTDDARAAAATLRRVIADVDAGDVEANSMERAHLSGAADAFDRIGGSTDR